MNIALMSHDRKKELMVQFCIAYCGILSKHTICATNTTGRLVAEATGLPARCEPRLREQCFGKYEGTPRDGAEFRISKTHFADRYDGGESMMQLAQRIYNLLDELRQDENKTYLLVAHNGIARVVESYFHDMTNEEYSAAGIKNCELVEYRFE